MKWIYYSKENYNEKEVQKDIAHQERMGYTPHHYGWVDDRFEIGFVKKNMAAINFR